MEDISYANFFKFISLQKVRIPLIETAVIQNEQVEHIITLDEQGYLKTKFFTKTISLQTYLQRLLENHENLANFHMEKSSKVCYFYKKGSRTLIHDVKIKEILSKPHSVLNVDLIQVYRKNLSEKDKFLHLKLTYIKNQYVANIVYGTIKVTDPVLTESILDIATIIIHCIEQATLKRVLQIEIEYLQDIPGSLWVVNVQKCIIVEAKYTSKYPINKEEDIQALSKLIPKDIISPKSPTILKLPQTHQKYSSPQYTFRRGQLRNIHSNLDSPIRMTPVSHMYTEDTLIENDNFKMRMVNSTDNFNYRPDTPNVIKEEVPADQLLIRELLKGFFTVNRSSAAGGYEKRMSGRTPTDLLKRPTTLRRTNNNSTVKTFQKLFRRREYDNEFIECVLKTYFKGKDVPENDQDFGMTSRITTEEFTQFLNTIDLPKEDFQKNRLVSPILEEPYCSQPSTPNINSSRKKIEFHFVKNILASRKLLQKNEKSKKKPLKSSSTKRIIDLCLASPRRRK